MKNFKLKIFLGSLYILSLFCFYNAYLTYGFSPSIRRIYDIVFFIFLSSITESFMVKFNDITISSGFAITLAAILLFGTFDAMIVVSLGVALRIMKYENNYYHFFNTPLYKTLFNIANMSISVYLASIIFNINMQLEIIDKIAYLKFSLLIITFLLINTLIISILVSILSKKNILYIYLNNIKFGFLNIVAMAPFGIVLAYLFIQYNIPGVLVLMVPIMLARYTFMLYIEAKSKYIETVKVLMHAIEARDTYTEGHSRRVANLVEIIARELKYSESRIEQLTIASFLHDVGKIGIDDNILNKPGKLSNEEYSIIQQHPEIGYNILKEIKDLGDISFIVRHHHERYDGNGYPSRLKPDQLNLDVYIVQLADSIDAMATDRPYRKALTQEDIINEVVKNKGTQFHPDVVDAYLNAVRKNIL